MEYLDATAQLGATCHAETREDILIRAERFMVAHCGQGLMFSKETTAQRIAHDRPCWPRWHWPDEPEELFRRTMN